MGNLDTERPDRGADGGLRTGVLLPALTDDHLWAALEARRTFATEDPNLALALRSGTQWMGGDIAAGTQRMTLWVRDADNEATTLQLLRGGVVVAEQSLVAAPSPQSIEFTVQARAGDIYVARAVQADGQMAWSGPLWVAGEAVLEHPQLSEVLSAPRDVDWDADGVADFNDEWIELHNPHDPTVSLTGYRIKDEGYGFWIPAERTLEAGGHTVFFKRETGISLSNFGEVVRLVAPDGTVVDEVEVPFQGFDLSKARCEGAWYERMPPSLGTACAPPSSGGGGSSSGAAEPLEPQAVAEVRALPEDTLAMIEGVVTAPPGLFHPNVMYIQDESGGLKIYRSAGLPPLAEGDRVRLAGYVGTSFGETDLSVPRTREIEQLGEGSPLLPERLDAGQLAAHPGELVEVTGAVEGWSGAHWYLNDGEESLFIYHDHDTGVERPFLTEGETRVVAGIVGWSEAGPRLMPRYESDVSTGQNERLPIAEARTHEPGTRVWVEGIVTAPPGLFHANVAYIQDESGGLKLYRATGFPELVEGDRVQVTGTLRLSFGELELSLPAEQGIEHMGTVELMTPSTVEVGTLADYPGELVRVSGTVEGWSGAHWYLHDRAESIFVYHDADTGVERPFLVEGEQRTVTGIVGWTEQGPRLMPRYERDIGEGSSRRSTRSSSSSSFGPTPFLSIAAARTQPPDTRVQVEGVVVAAPGVFASNVMYIQDDTAGIKIYRSAGLPALSEGVRVRLIGYVEESFGEMELSVPRSQSVERIGQGDPPSPLVLGPGELPQHPGELVQVRGRVEGWSGAHWYRFDGRSSLFVYHDRDTGVRRPYLTRDDIRTVVGIVGWSGNGPRLMPRYPGDVGARGDGRAGGAGPMALVHCRPQAQKSSVVTVVVPTTSKEGSQGSGAELGACGEGDRDGYATAVMPHSHIIFIPRASSTRPLKCQDDAFSDWDRLTAPLCFIIAYREPME